jgi:hypothetical protein
LNIALLGNLNLGLSRKRLLAYTIEDYFEDMNKTLQNLNLTQRVNVYTWERWVKNQVSSSALDHIYCVNPLLIENLHKVKFTCDDHLLIIFNHEGNKPSATTRYKRSLINYSNVTLCTKLEKAY